MQILILGMHRSGTSLTTRVVNMMGAYFAPEGVSMGFNESNPKGFWERRDVQKLNDALLRHGNSGWDHVGQFETTTNDSIPAPLKQGLKSLILEMDGHRPWVLKDPRLCITLGCWLPYLEIPVAAIVWRNPLEIVRSLQLRNAMPAANAMALWEYYAVHLVRHASPLLKVFTTHSAMMAEPVKAVHALYEGLLAHGVQGLRLPSEREVLAFLDPKLHRSHASDVTQTLTGHQQLLSAMLRGEVPFVASVQVSDWARQIMETMKPAAR